MSVVGAGGRKWQVVRVVLYLLFGLYFLVPLAAMAAFSLRKVGGGTSWQAWLNLVEDPTLSAAVITSVLLALLTVAAMLVLLVPTMIWVRLRVPAATRLLEFLCLLPLTIPALVIVVGLTNVYAWVTYLLGDSALTLTFVYTVLVLPYSYRALDAALSAIDVITLSEAARSLGAGWATVMLRVIVPNIWSGVLSAAFISVALVLGEYTIASLLNFNTLQTVIVLFGKSDAATSVAASLAALIVAFVLLVSISFVGRARGRRKGALT